jgi:hypothetical protein
MSTSSTDRIDQLALVWLMVPRKESRVNGFSEQLKPLADGADERKRLASESVARLRGRGMLEPGNLLQLTEAGRRSAAEILGKASPPKGKTTLQWAKKVLVLRSMEVATEPGAKGARVADVIAARIVARQYKVDRKDGGDPSSVLAALARRALGLPETAEPLEFKDALRAVFLMGRSPTPIDETGGNGHNGHSGPVSGTVPLRLEHCDLREFAQQVTEAARSSATGRWHGAVFISHVWSTLQARGNVGTTFEKFKRRLIEAYQQDLIELSRADLVDAMPPADVSASETVHSGARFHFVRPEQLAS